jgi:hypothetical protein
MQYLGDFFGVAFVVELEESLEDLTTGGFADRESLALLGWVEIVAEIEISPAVGGSDGLIHFDVQFSELVDVGG